MPKQSLAEKSVYWLKVISLGLILGIGIQIAQAWTSPGATPPGGNVSGPITQGDAPQYKTGMLGVNSTTIPVNALEVGGGGNAVIGGSVFTAGSVNAASGTVTGVLTAGKVQIVDVVTENTDCGPNGLVARDSVGVLLSCQSGLWKKASGGVPVVSCPSGTTDVGSSCVKNDSIPIIVGLPTYAQFGSNEVGGAKACANLGMRVANAYELSLLCLSGTVPSSNAYLLNTPSSVPSGGCNIDVMTSSRAGISKVLCAVNKK